MIFKDESVRNFLDHLQEGVYFVDQNRTITFWNREAERITGFQAKEVVGSRCMDNILNHVNESGQKVCQGLCPLATTISTAGSAPVIAGMRLRAGKTGGLGPNCTAILSTLFMCIAKAVRN